MSLDLLTEERSISPPQGAARPVVRERFLLACAAALLALHGVLAWAGRPAGILTRQDDATYVLLGWSLRAGGYNEVFRADAPLHNMYPPGYPALLSLWGWPFGDAFDALTLLNVLLSVATLGLAFLAFRRVSTTAIATLGLLPLAVNPFLVEFGGSIASEAPYAFFAVLAVYLLLDDGRARTGWRAVAAGAAAIYAALTRSIGVTLLAGLGLHWLIAKRWRAAALFALASALVVGPWLVWTVVAPEQFVGKSYVADALSFTRTENSLPQALVTRIQGRMIRYPARSLPWAYGLPTMPGTVVDNVVGSLLLMGGLIAGLIVLLRRWRPAALYVLSYGALLAVWPWHPERFLAPLLALIVPATVLGLHAAGGRVRPWLGMGLAAVFAVGAAAGSTSRTTELVASHTLCERGNDIPPAGCMRLDQVSYFNALRWLETNTPPDTRILTLKPEPLYLYTGRAATYAVPVLQMDPGELMDYLRRNGTDYVLLGSLQIFEVRRLPRILLRNCRSFAVEAFFPARTYLLRVLDPGEPPRTDACEAIRTYIEKNQDRKFGIDP